MSFRKALPLLLALVAARGFAYTYYYSDAFPTINTANWYYNGSLTTTANGLWSSTYGSLISKLASPTGADHEVKMTLALGSSGGYYIAFLRATPDALAAGNAYGNYYAVQLLSPTYANGSCSGTLQAYKFVSGAVTIFSTTTIPCHNGMTIRAAVFGSTILVYYDNIFVMWITDSSLAYGSPGVEVFYPPAGNGISRADLGPHDYVAPNAIPRASIGVSATPNRVDMQWQGVTDDPNGTGILWYQVVRQDVGGMVWENSTVFSDSTVAPSTTYTYYVQAVDYHWNIASTTVTVVTPPAGSPDARQVGVRPTGTYWGGAGENIDMRSGNLNFSIPLLKVHGRGWTVPFNLSYNSQNWREDGGGDWNLGRDSGFGYGWKLQGGALMPVYSGWFTIHHYLFIDATGAEYRLDQNPPGNPGVWYSKESIYAVYDSNVNRLYFPDGTFWVFGSTSSGTEQDSGVAYPTLIQDSNGNQITISYQAGQNVGWANSSARMTQINDVKGGYTFYYTTGETVPHLTAIQTNYPGESWNLDYFPAATLYSPMNGAAFGTTRMLSYAQNAGSQLTTTFIYGSNGSGELVQANFPYGGHLRWVYGNFTYPNSRTQREVQSRYLSMSSGAAELSYGLYPDTDPTHPFHYSMAVDDFSAHAEKAWVWYVDPAQPYFGLVGIYAEQAYPSHTQVNRTNYYWSTDSLNRPYISSVYKTLDVTGSPVQNRTDQVLDQYGNVTSMSLYDFGTPNGPPPGTPSRTYTNTYLNDSGYNHPAGSNYVAQHINNRLSTSTVQGATGPATTLVSNNYDMTPPADSPGITQHDPAYNTGYIFRGNVTSSSGVGGTMSTGYDIAGNNPSTNVNGLITTAGFNTGTNYAAPSSMTTNALTTTLNWTAYLALGSETGPNGDSASTTYDGALRPATTTSPFGAVTTFSYSGNVKTSTTNGHWVKTTMDGLGRTVQTETGDGAGTKSVVDTVYAACGCTPLGKMSQVSQPHAPGATQYWTTYAYDATGRTKTVTAADGSVTSYSYVNNTMTVKDPTNKWKQFTMDAFGNLTSVVEPKPGISPMPDPPSLQYPFDGTKHLLSSYTYDVLNHLTQVSMTRDGVTQTRTFNYGSPAGALLLSATNPENGTVTYTYNSDMTLATKTDAKNQQTQYSYDNYKRVYQVRHYPVAGGAEDTSQQVNYYYDSNPDDGGTFSHYVAGRLAVVKYGAVNIAGLNIIPKFAEWYSYNQPGGITAKRLQISETIPGSIPNTTTLNFDGQYTYDGEGKMTSVSYPSTFTVTGLRQQVPTPGPTYTYSFDSMSRAVGLTDQNSATLVSGVSYGPANELLGITYLSNIENRTYNNRLQLTNITAPGLNVTYNYTAGANNGKIASANDNGELIQYTYDSLNRLSSAAFATGTQGYNYDGFGNLTAKTVLAGSVPTMSIGIDASTNRLVGQNISYDANGNQTNYGSFVYDIENRLYTIPSVLYAYDVRNKRVWKGTYDGSGNLTSQEVYFYGIDGSKLGTYNLQLAGWYNDTLADSATDLPVYFGRKNISIVADRLGSRRYKGALPSSFYPYGEDKGTPVANDQIKFATYTRDSSTGLDYADQRYYNSTYGRFTTPDPYQAHEGFMNEPNRPLSWNRYSHVEGDPVNYNDPAGLFSCLVGSITTTAFGVTSTTLLWEECPSFLMPSPLPTGLTSARMSLGWLAMQWNDTHPHRNPGDKRLRTGLECQDDVINAMNDAWMRSGNGTSGKEAGFILVGSEQTYKIVPLAYTNEQGKITFTLPSGAFAVVHVHPNSSAPAPSDNDINVANSHQLLMFTESIRGLWLYDPSDKAKLLMATGVLWQQPCDQ